MTLHFFSPHEQYAHGEAFEEFRAMVQAFHAAGIEVWLDVVYNHTSEGGETGPTYSFRGIDNDSYYLLTHDLRHYLNDTGCGNTVRTGHPAGRGLSRTVTRPQVARAAVSRWGPPGHGRWRISWSTQPRSLGRCSP